MEANYGVLKKGDVLVGDLARVADIGLAGNVDALK